MADRQQKKRAAKKATGKKPAPRAAADQTISVAPTKRSAQRRRAEEDPADAPLPAPAGRWAGSRKLCRFILELGNHGNVTRALADADLNRAYAYDRRANDREFAAAWDEALKQGLQVLKDEAWRRAYEGVLEPKGVAGKKVLVRKYSDTLLMFLIKQHDPSFREHFDLSLANAGGRPFLFQMALHPEAVKQAGKEGA